MIPSNLRLLSCLCNQKKTISWLLLMLFTAVGCLILSPERVMTATVEPLPHHQTSNTVAELVAKGQNLYEAENYNAAIQTLKQALAEYQAQENNLRQAMVLSNIALAYQQLGEWQQVNTYVLQSLQKLANLAPTPEANLILAQTLDIKGRLQLAQGNAELAAQTWQQATETYREIGEETGIIRTRINQASALQASGYYRSSLKILNQLETTLQEQPDSITKAVGLRSLGNALLLVGETERAGETLQTSLEIAESLELTEDISSAFFSLGNIARSQLEYQQALAYYQQAALNSANTNQKIKAQLNQLSLLRETKTWSAIPPLLAEIEPLIPELPLTHEAIYSQINYAQNLIKLREQALPNQTSSFITQSQIENILTATIEQARQLEDKLAEAYALISLGRLYELENQLASAQFVTQQALIIAQNLDRRDIAYQGFGQLGRLLKVQGKDQQALAAYQQAVTTLQSLRSDLVAVNPEIQFTFRENIEPIYREYVGLLLKSADSGEKNLIAAREAIDSLQLAELENFFHATCLDAQPVVIDKITEQDDPTAAIIYPIVLEDRLEIILKLPQEKLRHYTTPIENPGRVERILQRLTQSLTQRNSSETLPLAQQVYNWIIEPAENDLANSNIKTLVFVLDSPLRNIPMSVLHDGQQYLIEKYALAVAPGLQLVTPRPIAQQQLKALTAGITEARGGFPPLRYVANELNTVQSQIPKTELLLNDNFTSINLQAKIAQIPFPVVHLATHGQFSSQAENTFILTWDDRINVNQLNNLLRNSDLGNEDAIELLVLSACETLIGDKRAALGLAGVAVRAGARSTLATLWRVNDEATALLMGQFYQELGNQTIPITKAEALRKAQLTLLKNPRFNRPHFWSSYVLVGNWL
ncbi:MAG: CHAT domain-containing protein [Xenococcaceae cyanobacterium MO_167.B27]|nr:CHAT domain-containing protein [Xenococcaceae cyanobacterium MO_167.B27]